MNVHTLGGDALQWTYVCRIADIVPNTGACALLGRAQIALFRLVDPFDGHERYHAIGNVDPASGAAVLARGLLGDADGEPFVASPIYKQRYRLRDGACLDDDALAVPVHPVRVADGWLLVARSPGSADTP